MYGEKILALAVDAMAVNANTIPLTNRFDELLVIYLRKSGRRVWEIFKNNSYLGQLIDNVTLC